MSFQEKNLFASILAMIATLAIFFPRVKRMYLTGQFEGAEGLILFGKTSLVFVGVGIAAVIGATILFSILHAIFTGEKEPNFLVDERDKQIERRGMQISGIGTGIGFMGAMLALMLGVEAVPAFFIITLAYAGGEFIAGLAKIAMYRLGI